jgi:RNA 2',3'-cyclic 3'-phosphodiesterase
MATDDGGDRLRLFVAFDVPDDVRDLVDRAIVPLRERYPTARWVPVENQHVTVKFLGPTQAQRLALVVERLELVAARHRPFVTRAAGLGTFPSARRARVLWVGLDDPEDRSAEVAADLETVLAPEFPSDARRFTPHLTLARFDPPIRLHEDVARLGVESPSFDVRGLSLYRSHLGRPASRYERLVRLRFGR